MKKHLLLFILSVFSLISSQPSAQTGSSSVPVNNFQPFIPSTHSIDKSRDVGGIPFSQSVTPTGALRVSVPIDIFPAANGFVPTVSLGYSSMAGDGTLGWGWQLSTGSVISRGNKTYYYDGESRSLTPFTKEGPFYLDGQRLILLSSGATKNTYETEQGFIKVAATINGNAITRFDVSYPSGIKNEYTNHDGINCYLTRSKNVSGDIIEYSYDTTCTPFILKSVTYGHPSKRAVTSFEYNNSGLSYLPLLYKAGINMQQASRLSGVTTTVGWTIYSRYSLKYSMRGGVPVVTQIDREASDGKRLNPLIFCYGNSSAAKSLNVSQYISPYNNVSLPRLRTKKDSRG